MRAPSSKSPSSLSPRRERVAKHACHRRFTRAAQYSAQASIANGTMRLDKTHKGRQALLDGVSAGLGLQARRILILADGRRDLPALEALLGAGIRPAIDVLLQEGYLADAPGAHASVAPAQVAHRAPAPSASAPASRRSLAASKMYLLDMLQLQRTPEAAELRAAIQCASGADEQVDALLHAVRELLASNATSYGPRVAARLEEILPEEALPRLRAIRGEQHAGPRLSVVA
jgi:hypothetical protein